MLLDGRAILLVTEMNGDDISDVYEAELELNKISAENKKVEIEDDLYPLDDLNDDPNKAGERVRRMLQNDPKEVKRVVQFYTDMANDGNAGAQYELANFYLEGLGVEKDEAKAKEWLQKAAKQGHQAAIELLENKIGK
jgi:TPR repeat protein